jgi:hypothetical protein
MAAALANVGAAILEKLTDESLTVAEAPTLALAFVGRLTPTKAADNGSKGTPESACNRERREKFGVFDMAP